MQPRLSTLSIHAGARPDPATGARAVPIYETTSFVFRDTGQAAAAYAYDDPSPIYTRLGNPTTAVLEARLAALHGAAGAVALASGQAATLATVLGCCRAGQNLVCANAAYGGTLALLKHTCARMGIEARFAEASDPPAWEKATDGQTRLYLAEAIDNPRGRVADVEALARAARRHGVPLGVDNTFCPPPVFDPFDHGADLAVYSLTKMVGGHGVAIGGAVVERGGFDWSAGGLFPGLAGPDPANHGLDPWAKWGKSGLNGGSEAFVGRLRMDALRNMGACMSPFTAWLLLLGVETLPLRARQHCANALAVARHLSGHPAVAWTDYAGLEGHPDHARAKAWMPLGPGAVMAFGLKGGREAGKRLINRVRLASHLANVLDAKTLVIHPASTTHSQLTEAELAAAGVRPEMVRLSVGLEDAADITGDLDQAMEG